MILNKAGRILCASIISLAILLAGLYITEAKKAYAAEEPAVRVLGASVKLSETDNNGSQSMRVGIIVDNAHLAKSCSINFKVGDNSYIISTDVMTDTSGLQQTSLYYKDYASDKVVYVAVIKDIPKENFYTPIEITGLTAGLDGKTYKSGTITRNVIGIVNAIRNKYPALNITIQDGTLYKNSGQDKLTATDIEGGSYAVDTSVTAEDIPMPTEGPSGNPTQAPTATPTAAAPTATPANAPTATPSTTAVPNADVTALRINASITVDGNADPAWTAVSAYPIQYYGTGKVSTSSTGVVRLLWNNNNLYALIDVEDPFIDYSNGNAWEQDGIEIFFDENNSKEKSYDNNNDAFQYRFTGLTGTGGSANTNEFASAGSDARTRYDARQFAYVRTAEGYRIECSVPFYTAPVAGQVVGFDITLMDCYNGTRNNEIWLTGSGKGNMYQDPSLFGNMKLSSEAIVVPTAGPTQQPTASPTPVPTLNPGTTYTVNLSDSSVVSGNSNRTINSNGSMLISSSGNGNDTFISLPSDEADKRYTKVTVNYSLGGGTFSLKYHKKGEPYSDPQANYNWGSGSPYEFASGTSTKVMTFDSAYYPVDQIVIFDWYSAGNITVNSIVFSDPLGVAPATPTPDPSDPYTTELFTVTVKENKVETVNGNTMTVDMRFFNGSASGTYFNGNILNGEKSCDVVKTYKSSGSEVHKARYFLDGRDRNGNNCRIFIEDNSISAENGTVITKPTFITNSSTLAFLEKADVRGYVTDDPSDSTGKTKIIRYRWNASNTNPVPFREVHIPDETHNYSKEVFTIHIDVGGSDYVDGANGSASMIYFGGNSNCSNFNGNIVASDADTRLQYRGTIQTLSARYMLSGTGPNGSPMRIYVENNGIDNNGMVTEPTIITDNPAFAYIETAPTHGTVSWETGLTIHLWTTP